MQSDELRMDYQTILDWIAPGASVLDLGCGDGDLLDLLVRKKQARGQGIEISEQAIHQCVAKGLSVFHDDIDNGLSEYGDGSFDYVVLNQSLQQVKKVDDVLREALRVGRELIVGFPNFVHYRARIQFFFRGRTPVTPALPYTWHDTPNLHFLSISDFIEYCQERNLRIKKRTFLGKQRRLKIFPNLFASTGLFLITNEK